MIDKIYDKNGKLIVHYKQLPKGDKFKSYDNRGFENPPTSSHLSFMDSELGIFAVLVGILILIIFIGYLFRK